MTSITAPIDAKSYYDQITAIDIGSVARDLLASRITGQDSHALYIDCPHHHSTSGKSFHVELDTQLFRCWGCGISGDVLQLVEFVKFGVVTAGQSGRMADTHRDARDWLAAKVGLPPLSHVGLTADGIADLERQQASYQRACAVLTAAADWYHGKLLANDAALAWCMEKYAFTREIVERFRIGYADQAGLRAHLYSLDFTALDLLAAGLFIPNDDDEEAPRLFFVNRLMFPYFNRGRVAYFIGRKTPWTPTTKWEQGKYKKLPVYDAEKRPWVAPGIANDLLFGEDILLQKPAQLVITEGITDCIALQARAIPSISPVTTNIRHDDWARIIPRLVGVKEVIICQDNEVSGAGWQGALNTAHALQSAGIACRVATLPLDAEQLAARETLEKTYGIADAMGSRAMATYLADRTEDERADAQQLLEAAKQDIASFFASGHTSTDFQAVIASAISPLEYAISALAPALNTIERDEMLDAILKQIAGQPKTKHTKLLNAICARLPEISKTDLRLALKDAGRAAQEERREASRASTGYGDPVLVNGNRTYYVAGNRIIRETSRETAAGRITSEHQVANFYIQFETERIVDDGEHHEDGTTVAERTLRGTMHGDTFTRAFAIESSAFGMNSELSKRITATAGTRALYTTNDVDDIRIISSSVSGELQREQVYNFFGHHPTEGFLSPSLTIRGGELLATADTGARVEIGQDHPKARYLDLLPADDATVRATILHLITDYWRLQPLRVTLPIFAHAFAGPILFCSALQQQAFSPYILFVTGSSGKGKTETARLAQCLWGRFTTKEKLASWASTPLSNRQQAAKCRGGLWLIDDFKRHRLQGQYQNAVNMLNDYADLQGRGRATRGAQMITQEPIRNMLLVTGEDMPYTETSALARSLIVEFASEEDTREQYSRCLSHMADYPTVMPRFIAWWQGQDAEEWLRRAEEERNAFVSFFARERLQGDNTVRLASSAALSLLAMEAFQVFCWSLDIDIQEATGFDPLVEHRIILQSLCRSMLAAVNEIRPAAQFIDSLVDLLVSGRVAIYDKDGDLQLHPDVHAKTIGHYDIRRHSVNLYTSLALAEIQDLRKRADGNGLQWSAQAIGKQLAEDGWLVDRGDKSLQINARMPSDVTIPGECYNLQKASCNIMRSWALDAKRLKSVLKLALNRDDEQQTDILI